MANSLPANPCRPNSLAILATLLAVGCGTSAPHARDAAQAPANAAPEAAANTAQVPSTAPCNAAPSVPVLHRFLQTPGAIHPAPSDVAAPPAEAAVTAQGLASLVLVPAPAEPARQRPQEGSRVVLQYTAWAPDGTMLETTLTRHEPLTIQLEQLGMGLEHALKQMTPGEIRRWWLPARGAETAEALEPHQDPVTVDIQLVAAINPPPAPADVAAAPLQAARTPSGLAYLVLTPGTGTEHPGLGTTVRVHYSGWTTDGRLFDSSVQRGKPARFQPNRVIAGWTETLLSMVEGEKRRIWIPAELAYGERPARPGAPAGMLVFEVELLELEDGNSQPKE